jgi:hypothetical protein
MQRSAWRTRCRHDADPQCAHLRQRECAPGCASDVRYATAGSSRSPPPGASTRASRARGRCGRPRAAAGPVRHARPRRATGTAPLHLAAGVTSGTRHGQRQRAARQLRAEDRGRHGCWAAGRRRRLPRRRKRVPARYGRVVADLPQGEARRSTGTRRTATRQMKIYNSFPRDCCRRRWRTRTSERTAGQRPRAGAHACRRRCRAGLRRAAAHQPAAAELPRHAARPTPARWSASTWSPRGPATLDLDSRRVQDFIALLASAIVAGSDPGHLRVPAPAQG